MSVAPYLLLANWLQQQHPGVFARLAAEVIYSGLGDDSDPTVDLTPISVDTGSIDTSGIDFGNTASPDSLLGITPTVDLQNIALPSSLAPDTTSSADSVLGITDPTVSLQPISVTLPTDVSNEVNTPVSSSPSVASSIASGVGSVVSAVGNFLASPGGVQSLVKLATAVVSAQTPVISTQAARAAAGLAPAPISYVTNPLTGAVTPVLTTTGGSVPVGNSLLSALTPSGLSQFVSQYGLYLGLGIALFMFATS